MIRELGGVYLTSMRHRCLRSGDARPIALIYILTGPPFSERQIRHFATVTHLLPSSISSIIPTSNFRRLTFDFDHFPPSSRSSVLPRPSRSSTMKITMTAFALAVLSGGTAARYCTAGLSCCGRTLKDIGTLRDSIWNTS